MYRERLKIPSSYRKIVKIHNLPYLLTISESVEAPAKGMRKAEQSRLSWVLLILFALLKLSCIEFLV